MTVIDAASGWTALIPGFCWRRGHGLVNPPLASTAVGVVPVERSGMASGINSTFRQVGIATGIAGLGAVFQHSVTHATTAALRAGGHCPKSSAPPTASWARCWSPAKSARSPAPSPPPRARPWSTPTAWVHRSVRDDRADRRGAGAVGAVLAFVLVRSRDFVSAGELPTRRPEPVACAAADRPPPCPARLGRGAESRERISRRGADDSAAAFLHTPRTRSPAVVDSVDRLGPCASARTARTPTRACSEPAPGAHTCRTAPRPGAGAADATGGRTSPLPQRKCPASRPHSPLHRTPSRPLLPTLSANSRPPILATRPSG